MRFIAIATGVAIFFATNLPLWAATRNVVVLYDERVELPGLALFDAEFVRTIAGSGESVEVYREAMDLSRFDSERYRADLRDFVRSKYANKRIDVAVGVLAPALDFLLTWGDQMFPGAQIVFAGLDRSQLGDRVLPPNTHGVLVKREFAPTLGLALGVHPAIKDVVVISGASEFDRLLLAQAQREFRAYQERVSITYVSDLPLAKLLDAVSKLSPQSIILFTTLFQDGAGQAFVSHDVVDRISAAASVPVYGFLDQYLGHGIVGGSLYSFSTQGAGAAKIVLALLDGKPVPATYEVPASTIMFDWRQMQRWGIGDDMLPRGAQIAFRDASIWHTYRWQIALMGAVVLLQGVLISGLLVERNRRRFAEIQTTQRTAELAHFNRHAMAGELTGMIAHELKQPLAAIMINTETAELMLQSPTLDRGEIGIILADIRRDDKRADEVIGRLRSLLKKTPFERKDADLNDIVRETIQLLPGLTRARETELDLELGSDELRFNGDRVQIQQVIINLVVNALDAMAALPRADRKMTVATMCVGDSAEITVSDAGPGLPAGEPEKVFEPFYTTKPAGMGMGLSIARTIIQAHGGQLSAKNNMDGGAVFRIKLPLAPRPQ